MRMEENCGTARSRDDVHTDSSQEAGPGSFQNLRGTIPGTQHGAIAAEDLEAAGCAF